MNELEAKYTRHDRTITVIFHESKMLVAGEAAKLESPKGRIGYRTTKEDAKKAQVKRGQAWLERLNRRHGPGNDLNRGDWKW